MLSTVETVISDVSVCLFLFLCTLILGLITGNPRPLLSGYLPKIFFLSTLCNIVIQKFHDSWEVLRVPIHSHDVFLLALS